MEVKLYFKDDYPKIVAEMHKTGFTLYRKIVGEVNLLADLSITSIPICFSIILSCTKILDDNNKLEASISLNLEYYQNGIGFNPNEDQIGKEITNFLNMGYQLKVNESIRYPITIKSQIPQIGNKTVNIYLYLFV